MAAHRSIKILLSSFLLRLSEAYLKTCQTFHIEHLEKIVTIESNIVGGGELVGKTSKK